jgi:hypothetical protein
VEGDINHPSQDKDKNEVLKLMQLKLKQIPRTKKSQINERIKSS